ncbi:MAG: Ig-like domain-containing protein [Pyrinomonadaceae bacterium]
MRASRHSLVLTLLLGTILFAASPARGQGSPDEAYFVFSDNQNPQTFVFKLTNPTTIQQARDILSTGNQKIVSGIIIKQPVYYNPHWSFHYDPKTIGFADATIEACQSTIQGIEDNLDGALPNWCPTTSLVAEIAPPPHPEGGNLSPTVSMTEPYRDDAFTSSAPANVTLKANADDPDGTISKVEFFHNTTKIGEQTTAPYSFTWNGLGAGTYSVSAVASDDQGATRASKSVRFRVIGIEDTHFFVIQHYLDFLNRPPEAEGLIFWTNNIFSCGAEAECREVKRIDTSAAFFLSIEFQETGYLAHRFYRASFGRRPLFAEFLPDQRAIGNGVVVNSLGWEQLLESNKRAFADSWVARSAFSSIYDALSNELFVDTLIANTGVTFTDTDRNAFVDVLNTQVMTRAQILRLIAEDQSFYNAEYNSAFVEMEYFGYLRRDPDEGGFNFWLTKLNNFDGDFRRAEMVKSFLVSGEYLQRFGTPLGDQREWVR